MMVRLLHCDCKQLPKLRRTDRRDQHEGTFGSKSVSSDIALEVRDSRLIRYKILHRGFDKLKDSFYGDLSYHEEHEPRAEPRHEIADLESSKLRAVSEGQNRRIVELETMLVEEQMKCKQLKDSTDKMILKLENKDLFIGRQDSDSAVVSQFSHLIDRVATWSIPFAQHEHTSTSNLPQIPKEDLRRVVPVPIEFFRSPKEVRLFVRGFVSLAMTEMLIRTLPGGGYLGPPVMDLWMDEQLAHAFNTVEIAFFDSGRCSSRNSSRNTNDSPRPKIYQSTRFPRLEVIPTLLSSSLN